MPQVSRDVAESDFLRFAAFARLRLDRNDAAAKEYAEDKETFITAVCRGEITVADDGTVTVHTTSEELPEVRFTTRPKVAMLRAMDRVTKGGEQAKFLAMVSAVTGVNPRLLDTLEIADFENVAAVFSLFLGR